MPLFESVLTVGSDDTGHDVKFYGATSGEYMLWDESEDALRFTDNTQLRLGIGNDLRLWHNGTNSYVFNYTGNLYVGAGEADKDTVFLGDDGSAGDVAYLTLDGSATNMKAYKDMRFVDNVDAEFGEGGDFKIYHDGSNTYLEQINAGTGNIVISNANNDADIIFKSDDGSGGVETYFYLDGSNNIMRSEKEIRFVDSAKASFGNAADLKLYHDGSNSFIESNTGNLTIDSAADDADIIFKGTDGEADITALTLDMSDAGTAIFNHDILLGDNSVAAFGDSNDLSISHVGGEGLITNNTGNITIRQNTDNGKIIFETDDETGGVETYVSINGTHGHTRFTKNTRHNDNAKAFFGGGDDLEIYHDGSNSYISDTGTGSLYTLTDAYRLTNAAGNENMIWAAENSFVKLYYNNSAKLETVTGGVEITGELQADTLDIDGAADISGALVLGADSTVGWHGSVTRVKILPSDFKPDNGGRPVMTAVATNTAYLFSNGNGKMFASIPIPTGFKATHVKIHGSDTGQTFTVYEANIANKTTSTKGTATAIETEKAITNVDSTTTNYILIEVTSDGTPDEIHGGYMTIAAI